jgi:hypothetical protein
MTHHHGHNSRVQTSGSHHHGHVRGGHAVHGGSTYGNTMSGSRRVFREGGNVDFERDPHGATFERTTRHDERSMNGSPSRMSMGHSSGKKGHHVMRD